MKPEQKLGVVYRKVRSKTYLGKMDRTAYLLNDVSSRMWELIDGERTPEEIADIMASEFDVEREMVLQDFLQFQADLLKHDLITLEDGA